MWVVMEDDLDVVWLGSLINWASLVMMAESALDSDDVACITLLPASLELPWAETF